MKMAIKIFVGLVFACIAIGLAMVTANSGDPRIRDYLGEKVIDVRGRVFDHATNQGIPNAFVIVELFTWSGEPFTGHGASSCNGGEVVRTDSEGNYHFVWDWQKEYGEDPPDDITVHLKAFATGWMHHVPFIRNTGGWQITNLEGPDIVMTQNTMNFDERVKYVSKLNGNACHYGSRRLSYLALYEAMQSEYWAAYCAPDGDAYSDLSWEKFSWLEGRSVWARANGVEFLDPSKTEGERYRRMYALMDIGRKALPAFQRPDPSLGLGFPKIERELTSEEKSIACRDYSPEAIKQWVTP